MGHPRRENRKCGLQSICVSKRKEKININFKFSGEGKGSQNNKELETLRSKNRVFL